MMEIDQFQIYAVLSAILFTAGFYSLLTDQHLLRKIVALNIMSSGVFLLLVNIAKRNAAEFPDPVPHGMVLTGIVVTVSVSALAMMLARRIHQETGCRTLFSAEESASPGGE